MNLPDKSKDELILELNKLKKENELLLDRCNKNSKEKQKTQDYLKQSESTYHKLLERMSDGYYKSSPDGKFIEVNQGLADILGYKSVEELMAIDINTQLYINEDDRNEVLKQDLLKKLDIYPLKKKDGSKVWVEDNGWYIRDENNEIIYHEGIIRDVTERKNADDRIKESEAKYRLLIEQMQEGLLVVDHDDVIQFANTKFCEMLGYNLEELIGKVGNKVLLDESDRDFIVNKNIQRKKGIKEQYELSMIKKNGDKITLQMNAAPVYDNNNNIVGSMSTSTDVTEQKRIQQQLIENKNMLDLIINTIPQSIFWKDSSGKYIGCNQLFANAAGLSSPEDIVGKTDYDLPWPKEEADKYILDDKEVINTNKPKLHIVESFQLFDKTKIWIETSKVPLRNDHGETVGVIGVFEDITKRKEATDALRNNEVMQNKMVSNIGDVIVIADTNKIIRYKSPNIEKLFGWKPDEMIGKNALFLVHPEDKDKVDNMLNRIGKEPFSKEKIEVQYRCKNGEYRWIQLTVSNLVNDPVINGFLGNYNDITLRKKSEEKIKESEEKFRFLFDNMTQGIVYHNSDMEIIYANASASEILGLSSDELLGKKPTNPRWRSIHEDGSHYPGETHPGMITFKTSKPVYDQIMGVFIPEKNHYNWIIINSMPKFKTHSSELDQVIVTFENITKRKEAEDKIEHYLNLMKYIIEHTQSAIAVHDRDLNYIYVSKRYLEEYKIKDSNIIGKHHYEVFPELPQKWRDVHQKCLKGEVISADNDIFVKDDGSIEWTRWECRPWFEADGKIGGIIVYTQVITEQKNAQDELRDSEERFKALHNASFGGITIHDKGIILECNQGLSGISGYSYEELIGMDGLLLIAEQSREKVMKNIQIGYERPYEATGLRKNGDEYPLRLEAKNIPYKGKNVRVVEFRDITEQKKAELALKDNLDMLHNLTQQVPGVVYKYILRPDGSSAFPFSSTGMWDIYEVTSEEVKEDASIVFTRIHPDDYQMVADDIMESAKNLTLFHSEYRVVLPEQGLRWRESHAKPLLLDDGCTLWYGIIQDITERKQSERLLQIQKQEIEEQYEEYMQINSELQETNQHLEKAKEKAEESDKLKSAFLANMSHEIRTPMNGILGFAQLLKEPNLTGEEYEEYLSMIDKSGKRMISIINDIVDISKIEAGIMNTSYENTNINEKLEYIYSFFKPEAESRGLSIILSKLLPEDSKFLYTDREKIIAVVSNLIKNSIKFSFKGTIEFGCVLKNNFVEFFVKDQGIGIPEERHEAIFDRFIQADITDEMARQGAGLGLSISKAYIEMLGGSIRLKSKIGEGTEFYFTIPYEEEKNDKQKNIIKKDFNNNKYKNMLKVIIAEDDKVSEKLISIALKDFTREVITVTNGIEVIEKFNDNPDTDLIMMDIKMPKMNGIDATRKIRENNKDVIIIAQTAYALSGDRELAIEAGCNDYIAKPINKDKLLDIVFKYFDK